VKKEKHPVCGGPVGKNALLTLEVRGEWATTAEDPTGYHSSPLQNRKKEATICKSSPKLEVEDWKNVAQSGLMSLDFC